MEYGQGVYTVSARYGFTINMFEEWQRMQHHKKLIGSNIYQLEHKK